MKIVNLRYLTAPIIVHSHGHSYRQDKSKPVLFDRLKDKVLSGPKRNIGAIPDLTIVTWSSREEITPLEENLKHFGLSHLVMGKEYAGVKWYQKFKLETLKSALADIKTEFIMGLDSFDVLLLGDPKNALARFRRLGCEMLFNASCYNWPPKFKTSAFEESAVKGKFRYLNSGCFLVRTEFLRKLLEDPPRDNGGKQKPPDDQAFCKLMYQKYYPKIKIDSRCEIFQSLKRVKAFFFMGNLFAT
jgi:hypothetical protein